MEAASSKRTIGIRWVMIVTENSGHFQKAFERKLIERQTPRTHEDSTYVLCVYIFFVLRIGGFEREET
jgi:hypothetical protein